MPHKTIAEGDKCVNCGARGTQVCDFPLTGAKAGALCSRLLCVKCAIRRKGQDYCPAHAELLKKQGKLR